MLRCLSISAFCALSGLVAQPRIEKVLGMQGWCCDQLMITWTEHPVVTLDQHTDAECVLYVPGACHRCVWQSEDGIHSCSTEKTKKPLPGTRITIRTDPRYSIRYATTVREGKSALVILFVDQQVCARLKNHTYVGGIHT